MKKNIFFLVPAFLFTFFFLASCNKDDTTTAGTTANVQGKWTGVYTPPLGPSPYYALTFNSNGTVLVEQRDMAAPDVATGTWTISGNNINATYTFTGAMTGTFSIAGTYNATTAPAKITGTIGSGSATSGVATFTVTK